MKFGKYLRATQTPEWKKKYIDYSGLKKRIKAIRKSQEGNPVAVDSPIGSKHNIPLPGYDNGDDARKEHPVEACSHRAHAVHTALSYCSCTTLSDSVQESDIGVPDDNESLKSAPSLLGISPANPQHITDNDFVLSPVLRLKRLTLTSLVAANDIDKAEKGRKRLTLTSLVAANDIDKAETGLNSRRSSLSGFSFLADSMKRPSHSPDYIQPLAITLPLDELYPLLSPLEKSFFEALDAEVQKIESFYTEREEIVRRRAIELEEQLIQLSAHKSIYLNRRSSLFPFTPNFINARLSRAAIGTFDGTSTQDFRASRTLVDLPHTTTVYDGEVRSAEHTGYNTPVNTQLQRQATHTGSFGQARKKLKRAMLEHYRSLEMLDNYRILNKIGFEKALKKFEKVTKIPSLQAYMKEKVEPNTFADETRIQDMMKAMERLFATEFGDGNRKKAAERLRIDQRTRLHHFSTFRTGLMLGIGVPALFSGLYNALRTHDPRWESLLYVYAILFVPTIFSLFVGLNIMVWSRSRISYSFIFDLDVRTQLDNTQYFEIPAFLLTTLVCAFWLSFSNVLGTIIDPTKWPLIWLAFTALILVNPLPVLFKPSRWWFLKNVGKLMISGTHPVEFTAFWMADQFCSMAFTLSNLYFMGCTYATTFEGALGRCGSTGTNQRSIWVLVFFMGALPNFIRLVQSIRRYYDTQVVLHLVNGGKYFTSIVSLLFYFRWRAIGLQSGHFFRAWIAISLLQTAYTTIWDLLMDWSVMRLKCRYRFLRDDLVYGFIPVYYFAILSNVLIRFTWTIFIPVKGPSMEIRSFIVAFLEMCRRFQWNFYRVENEHVGNVDQYRATRDIKLPFSFDAEDEKLQRNRSLLKLSSLSLRLNTKDNF